MPDWQLGLINLRGNLVPVFDLKAILELEPETQEKPWLLVLDRGDRAVGLFADGLPRAVSTSRPMERLPPLPAVLRPHVAQAFTFESIVWSAFDHRGFFQSLAAQVSGMTG
jgi:chemotaxis signal transduction protein